MHEVLNALFVGGNISQTDLRNASKERAHIGRIELSNNMWSWSKKVSNNAGTKPINIVYGLAVDPSGAKVAVYTQRSWYAKSKNPSWIIVLDAATGDSVSATYKIYH